MFLKNLLQRKCSIPFLLGSILVLWFCSSQVFIALASAGSKVEYLPGFRPEGPLPFELETGYIGVGESEYIQLFYYFVKSKSNPSVDPIVLWISGGPGCSSFYALTQELGPLVFDIPKNNWTLPTLSLNPYSWTKVASFIFLDLPVGTGFSYVKSSKNYTSNTLEVGDHAAEFIRKWFVDHFEYQSNPFYVGGDSDSGITVPVVVQAISNAIDARLKPHIDLKLHFIRATSLAMGSLYVSHINYGLHPARGFSIIPDELYQSVLEECEGHSQRMLTNPKCSMYSMLIAWYTLVISPGFPLDTNCNLHIENQSSFAKRFRGFNARSLDPYIRYMGRGIAYQWANDDSVQEAIHVKKGSIEKWEQCRESQLPYEETVHDTKSYHANFGTKGYRSLIYSGGHDMFVPSVYTEEWTKSLNYSIIDDWRQWFLNKQIAGYTRTFSNNMTYAAIKGSGHLAPTNTPLECFVMFKRWISYEKL